MKENWVKVKDRWNALAKREKQMLSIGGGIVLLFLLYQCLWSPLLDHVEQLREKLQSSQKLLSWMQEADKKISVNAAPSHPNVSPMMLLSQVKTQIQNANLAQNLKELKQSGSDTIEVHFQKVDFNALLQLLSNLSKNQGITLAKIAVVGLSTPGTVNADVYLK